MSFQDHWKKYYYCYTTTDKKWHLEHQQLDGRHHNSPSTPPQQTQEWKNFYTRVLDYLETLDIDPEAQDDARHGWKQIKMMFQGEDRQALQSLIDNNTITPEDQKTPKHALKAIQSCIKEEEHFWHFRDEVMSDFRQQPGRTDTCPEY